MEHDVYLLIEHPQCVLLVITAITASAHCFSVNIGNLAKLSWVNMK